MRTIDELSRLENLAFETGLRHEALQAEFERRENAVTTENPTKRHARRVLVYLRWLYNSLEECFNDPNRNRPPPYTLKPFNEWAKDTLGMSVEDYLK